jgi:hypothetical protein
MGRRILSNGWCRRILSNGDDLVAVQCKGMIDPIKSRSRAREGFFRRSMVDTAALKHCDSGGNHDTHGSGDHDAHDNEDPPLHRSTSAAIIAT